MAGEPQTLVIGNLTEDATINFTASGRQVANVNIANNPRYFNKQTNQWEEGETWFVRGSIWNDYAANVVESLRKGMQVMAWGRLVNRSFEDKQGNQRSSVEMQIDEIGPTLRFATAQVNKSGAGGGQGGGGWNNQPPQGGPAQGGQQSAPAGQQGQWGQGPGQGNSAPQNPGQGNGPWGGQPGGGWDQGQDSPPPF